MNINEFDIDFSKFALYNINFSHVHARNKIICANCPDKYNRDWFLFTNGESYLSIDVYGCISKVKDCRKAYLNKNLIALGIFYDNIPESIFYDGKWFLETYENANNLRIRKKYANEAKRRIRKETREKVFEKSHGRCAKLKQISCRKCSKTM